MALTLMLFSATAAVPALSHPLSQKPAGQRGKCSSVTYLRCFKRQLSAAVPPESEFTLNLLKKWCLLLSMCTTIKTVNKTWPLTNFGHLMSHFVFGCLD